MYNTRTSGFLNVGVWVLCQPADTLSWLWVTRIALLVAGLYKCWTTDSLGPVYFCVVFGGSEFKSRLWYSDYFTVSWFGHSHLAIRHVIRPESLPSVHLQFTFLYSFIVHSWDTESVFNKTHIWHAAKAKEDSRRPFELDAQGRQNFRSVGTLLDEAAVKCVFLPVHGVSLSLSVNDCWIVLWHSLKRC